jgi:hypothetical protein
VPDEAMFHPPAPGLRHHQLRRCVRAPPFRPNFHGFKTDSVDERVQIKSRF